MTFLAYLAAQGDANCLRLHECLSWLSDDGPTSLSEAISLIRMSRSAAEASLLEQEAAYRWALWLKSEQIELSEEFASVLNGNLSDLYA